MRTKVTALVPAYEAAGFIQKTLGSLSAQTHTNFDVIISVDLCDDDTYEICEEHCNRDSRFSVIKQKERLGYVGNCNFLLNQADSNYVLFAFHDDILAPEYIQKLSAVLDNKPEVIMAYSDLLLTFENGKQELKIYKEVDGLKNRVRRGQKLLWKVGIWWVPNRGLFRLRESRQIGGLKTHACGEVSTDLPWLFHMSLLGQFTRVPETLCFKFFMPGSFSRNCNYSNTEFYAISVACLKELWNSKLSLGEKLWLTAPFCFRVLKYKINSLLQQARN